MLPKPAFEEFDIPVAKIHAPVVPKNIIAEPVQIPLTPRTERINTKAFDLLRIPEPEYKSAEDWDDINEACNHPYTLKLKSMEIRSAQFADRAAKWRQKWLERSPEKEEKKRIIIEFKNEDPTRPISDALQSALKEESQFEKPRIKREGIDTSVEELAEELAGWEILDESDLIERRGPSLAEMVIATRELSPEWDELDDDIQSTQSL